MPTPLVRTTAAVASARRISTFFAPSFLPAFGRIAPRAFSSTGGGGKSGFDVVGCVGLGLMGHGICQVAASASNVHSKVIAYEKEQKFLDAGRDRITKSLDRLVESGKLTLAFANDTVGRIEFTTDMDALRDADFIVEAIIENMDLKEALYTKLGALCKPETVFASNTSSLSISEMAAFSGRPDRFVGIHFFNPVQIMKLVEVIHTDKTDPAVFEKASSWVTDIGKIPVSCGDTPGFIVNRLLVPSLMQAMAMVDRKDASVPDIDQAMKLGAGHPMGPLHLADYIGLDTCLFIVQGWVEKYPDEPSFFIPDCLQAKVVAGDLGRKSGRGFYEWNGDKRGDPVA